MRSIDESAVQYEINAIIKNILVNDKEHLNTIIEGLNLLSVNRLDDQDSSWEELSSLWGFIYDDFIPYTGEDKSRFMTVCLTEVKRQVQWFRAMDLASKKNYIFESKKYALQRKLTRIKFNQMKNQMAPPQPGDENHTEDALTSMIREQYRFESEAPSRDELNQHVAGMELQDWTDFFLRVSNARAFPNDEDSELRGIDSEEVLVAMQVYPSYMLNMCLGLFDESLWKSLKSFKMHQLMMILDFVPDHFKESKDLIRIQMSKMLTLHGINCHLIAANDLIAYLRFGRFKDDKRKQRLLNKLFDQSRLHKLVTSEQDISLLIEHVPLEKILDEMILRLNDPHRSYTSKKKVLEKLHLFFNVDALSKEYVWKNVRSDFSHIKDPYYGRAVLETFKGYEMNLALRWLRSYSQLGSEVAEETKLSQKSKKRCFSSVFKNFYMLSPWMECFSQNVKIIRYIIHSERYINCKDYLVETLSKIPTEIKNQLPLKKKVKSWLKRFSHSSQDLIDISDHVGIPLLSIMAMFSKNNQEKIIRGAIRSNKDYIVLMGLFGHDIYFSQIIHGSLMTTEVIQRLDLKEINGLFEVLDEKNKEALKDFIIEKRLLVSKVSTLQQLIEARGRFGHLGTLFRVHQSYLLKHGGGFRSPLSDLGCFSPSNTPPTSPRHCQAPKSPRVR